jgi:anthranilate/para-aminobenzoate synthase component II
MGARALLCCSLFLSNGPGDPTMCKATIDNLRKLLADPDFKKPIFGICLGNQLLGLAAGESSVSRFEGVCERHHSTQIMLNYSELSTPCFGCQSRGPCD